MANGTIKLRMKYVKYSIYIILAVILISIASLLYRMQLVFLDNIDFAWAILGLIFFGGIFTLITAGIGIVLNRCLNFIQELLKIKNVVKINLVLLGINAITILIDVFSMFSFTPKYITLTIVALHLLFILSITSLVNKDK